MIRVAIWSNSLPDNIYITEAFVKRGYCLKYNVPIAKELSRIKMKEFRILNQIEYEESEKQKFDSRKKGL